MKYLSAAELIAINEVVTELSGGSAGVRERHLLESITIKPQTSFGGEELYPDIYLKAAVLYEAIVNYHVFVDGNKRTGFAAMVRFLDVNGFSFKVTNQEIEDYTVAIATDNTDLAEDAVWIKKHAAAVRASS